jgi:lipoyl(octanoyl) transferase
MTVIIKNRGLVPYESIWEEMKSFTINRHKETPDEIWLVEHPPVFTQGQAGKEEHILVKNDIPIIQSDRGGQVTYHGPGQLVVYLMINLKRHKLSVRGLVTLIENSIISLLSTYDISANCRPKAPGVYVNQKKICSLGLRIKMGCSYHGLALNVNTDLKPFSYINPCGMEQLEMTNISDFISQISFKEVESRLIKELITHLGYNEHEINFLTDN